MLDNTIAALVTYAEQNGLITEDDRVYSVNALLERLRLDSCEAPETVELRPVHELLDTLTHGPGPVRHRSHGLSDPPALSGPAQIPGPAGPGPQAGHRLVLRLQRGHQLHPLGPHPPQPGLEGPHGIRRPGHHRQPEQAREGYHHRRGFQGRKAGRRQLPQVHALHRKRGLRGPVQPSRPAEPPARPLCAGRGGLVPAILPLRLLQRALHRLFGPAHPHGHRRPRPAAAFGLRDRIPPLFHGLQRGPAHRGRLHLHPRPFPGRALRLRHGQGPHRNAPHLPGP